VGGPVAVQGRKLAGLPRFCPHMTGWKVKTRDALLIVTIEFPAATLSLALPNLGVEIARGEEVAQTQTLTLSASPHSEHGQRSTL